ncbi:MAG: TonB family protein [Acidobacteriaceae bacterium]|nr:TonB family protein [Acidobacteriaceae bacterium]MBV8573041.1 TonB family protein [Acidobacteriaceae bacterium]
MISSVEKEAAERPQEFQPHAGLDRLLIASDLEEPWYKSVVRSIRETLNPPKLPPLVLTSRPLESADLGDMSRIEAPWYKSLISNIRDLIHPPKLPPLQVTSKPVEVGDIWGAYAGGQKRSGLVSVLIHVGVIGLMLLIFQSPAVQKKLKHVTDIYFPVNDFKPKLPPAAQKAGGGGGGGQKAPTPVSKGAAPKFAPKQFMPPKEAVVQPKLPVVPTITAPAPQIVADNYADPLSKLQQYSGGPGTNGLGSGSGGGVGSGDGDGYGPGHGHGMGGGVYRIGGDVSAPSLITKVEPEYSEEARKAKYSGTVLLSIIVDADGMPRNIHVVRPLGLGLDEKAIEAVMKWRFRPGMKGGHPVATQAQVEVNFRLL